MDDAQVESCISNYHTNTRVADSNFFLFKKEEQKTSFKKSSPKTKARTAIIFPFKTAEAERKTDRKEREREIEREESKTTRAETVHRVIMCVQIMFDSFHFL